MRIYDAGGALLPVKGALFAEVRPDMRLNAKPGMRRTR